MAKIQYRFFGRSKWQGLSGNAIIAITNTPGSGKKISVSNIEVLNNTLFGKNFGANTNAPTPVRTKIAFCTALSNGTSITPSPLDSAASAWPSTVQVKTNSAFAATLVAADTSRTDTTHAAGSLTFTPNPASAWIANEHRDAGRYLVVTTGNNQGTYKIVSNTATALTLERPLGSPGTQSAQPTTGTISEYAALASTGLIKLSTPSISNMPVNNFGLMSGKDSSTGSIFNAGHNTNQQDITIRAGEKLAVFSDNIQCNYPMMIEATLVVAGTPNRTYMISEYISFTGEHQSLFSIDNNTGSGLVVYVTDIRVSELGTVDTPYFQVVPIGSVDPSAYDDTDKQLSVDANDSLNGALASTVGQVFTNVPILPFGVPISYLAEGSAGSPKGFNYLNTKDFLGPVYMTFFPEAACYAEQNSTYWTAGAPGTFNTHVDHTTSIIKGKYAPIVLREGDGVAIVSGAETATITTAIGVSGWSAYEFGFVLTVENLVTPTIEFTGLKAGSEVRAYLGTDPATAVEIGGTESSSTVFSFTHDVGGQAGYVQIMHINYLPVSLNFSAVGNNPLGNYQSAVVSVPIQQITERNYYNP